MRFSELQSAASELGAGTAEKSRGAWANCRGNRLHVYVCRYHVAAGQDISWLEDKEEQVRVKGKVMYIKRAAGEELKTTIRRTTKAGQ